MITEHCDILNQYNTRGVATIEATKAAASVEKNSSRGWASLSFSTLLLSVHVTVLAELF